MADPIVPAAPAPEPVPAPAPVVPAPPPAPPAPAAPVAATVAEATLRQENQRLAAERDQALALANSGAGIREQLVRARIETLAVAQGLVDPGLARYLPVTGANVDAAGNVTGIEAVVAGWRTAAPGAFRGGAAPAPAPGAPVVVGQPPAVPVVAAPVLPSFGPGHAAPPPNAPPTAVDVRTLKGKDYTAARDALREQARQADRAAGVH